MRKVISFFCQGEQSGLGTYTDTLATVKACLQLPQKSYFVRYERAYLCLVLLLPLLVNVSAWYIVISEPGKSRKKKLVENCRVFIKAVEDTLSKRMIDSWAVLDALIPVQIFYALNMHFGEIVKKDAALR